MKKLPLLKSISFVLIASCASSYGAVVTGVGATASTTWPGLSATNLVNNAGLVGAGPYGENSLHTENTGAADQWHSSGGVVNDQFITFDLDSVGTQAYDLTSIHIWQANQSNNYGRGVKQFDLLYSTNNGASWLTALTDSTLAISSGGANVSNAAQNFSLALAGVTHVKIEIDSSWNGTTNDYVGLSEVKFSGTAVPEPSAALLGGLGMLALLRRRRNV